MLMIVMMIMIMVITTEMVEVTIMAYEECDISDFVSSLKFSLM